jgi:hypothetical protein
MIQHLIFRDRGSRSVNHFHVLRRANVSRKRAHDAAVRATETGAEAEVTPTIVVASSSGLDPALTGHGARDLGGSSHSQPATHPAACPAGEATADDDDRDAHMAVRADSAAAAAAAAAIHVSSGCARVPDRARRELPRETAHETAG